MFLIMLFETSTRVSKPKKFCCGFIENIGRDPFNQNSNRSDREKRIKRWASFFETFPVGPNRSIEFWTEISGNFG